MAATKDKDSKKTMDVSKPGESTPDTSARPIIVTHAPMMKDPMVKDEQADTKPSAKSERPESDSSTHGEKIISPVNAPEEVTQETEKNDTEKEQAQEAAVVDAVADQATEDKKKKNKDSAEETSKQEALQKLIDQKKYFVKVGQVNHRRKMRAEIAILVIFIIFAGFYLAIDAGAIKSSISLPFDLIKN